MSLTKVDKQLKDHLDYIFEVDQLIITRKFYDLMKFTNFSLYKLESSGALELILRHNNRRITKHIIDNMIFINYIEDKHGWAFIHSLIAYSGDLLLIKYFVRKYHIDLETTTKRGGRSIHIACEFNRIENVKFLIDEGVDLEAENIRGYKPIHLVCQFGSLEMLQLLINRSFVDFPFVEEPDKKSRVDLEAECEYATRPIHVICRFGTLEMIQFLVNKGVNLEAATDWGWRPIHAVCHYQNYETIKYFLSKNINLTTKINRYNDAIAEYTVKDLLRMNDKLSPEQKEELLEIISKRENE